MGYRLIFFHLSLLFQSLLCKNYANRALPAEALAEAGENRQSAYAEASADKIKNPAYKMTGFNYFLQ
jgi:hypothetical protein